MEALELEAVAATLFEVAERFDGGELTDRLDEFGWLDLYATERSDAVPALFLAQGRSGAWSSSLHDILAANLGARISRESTVLIPMPHHEVSVEVQGALGTLDGLMVGARSSAGPLIAVGGTEPEMQILEVPRQQATVTTPGGLDARLAMNRVTGQISDWEVLAEGDEAFDRWRSAVAEARRSLAFGICGAMEAMLDLAVVHANERVQFGRPIGTFQAVRHRLALCRVMIAGAIAVAAASATSDEPEFAALLAKMIAGRAQLSVGTHCQQVLAGIGFTAEHPFHSYLARCITLDRLFGSASELAPVVGRTLIRRGEVPRLVEL